MFGRGLLSLLIFSIVAKNVHNLQCYRCDSNYNSTCSDGQVKSHQQPVDCPKKAVCLKGVRVDGSVGRACSTVARAKEICGDRPTHTFCGYCANDLCNSSKTVVPSYTYIILFIPVLLNIVVIFIH